MLRATALLLAIASAACAAPIARNARDLASERLETQASCSDLFSQLGDVPREAPLRQATLPEEMNICRPRHAAAFVRMGSAEVVLCRSFRYLRRSKAAATIIHEELHLAGLPEKPMLGAQFWPYEITQLVRQACDL